MTMNLSVCGKRYDPKEPGQRCGKDDPGVKEYMKANHPEAFWDDTIDDGDLMMVVELLSGHATCKYPLHPWFDNKFTACDRCDSRYSAFMQAMIWGGPCSNAWKVCDQEGMNDQQKAACEKQEDFKCACDCKAMIDAVDSSCSPGQDLCDPKQPSACKTKTKKDGEEEMCDYGTYSSSWKDMNIWTGKMKMSKCLVDGKSAANCVTEQTITSSDKIHQWYEKVLIHDSETNKDKSKQLPPVNWDPVDWSKVVAGTVQKDRSTTASKTEKTEKTTSTTPTPSGASKEARTLKVSLKSEIALGDQETLAQFIADDKVKEGFKKGVAKALGNLPINYITVELKDSSAGGGRRLGETVVAIDVVATIKIPASEAARADTVEKNLASAAIGETISAAVVESLKATTGKTYTVVVKEVKVAKVVTSGQTSDANSLRRTNILLATTALLSCMAYHGRDGA